jgi:glycosyltransferase involved in cell wall biosynthesis
MSQISIIVPCYNHGKYLDDAIKSIHLEKYADIFELIIVNDGSTDDLTLQKMKELESKGFQILHQDNRGLAAARNAGVSIAKGQYILPLDSDNKIIPEVFIEAAKKMDKDETLDVVYTNLEYFGNKRGERKVGHFDGVQLLASNYLDACALIRKKTLVEVGFYDGSMPGMGTEDWELWINMFLHNKKFAYLPKIGFFYRVVEGSMSTISTRPNLEKNRQYFYNKHAHLIAMQINAINEVNRSLNSKIYRINNLTCFDRLKVIVKLLLRKRVIY